MYAYSMNTFVRDLSAGDRFSIPGNDYTPPVGYVTEITVGPSRTTVFYRMEDSDGNFGPEMMWTTPSLTAVKVV